MHLVPTQDEVVALLRESGALRDGHFAYPTGLHSNEYLQVPLALRRKPLSWYSFPPQSHSARPLTQT